MSSIKIENWYLKFKHVHRTKVYSYVYTVASFIGKKQCGLDVISAIVNNYSHIHLLVITNTT
jgi:hypothetical protein